MLASSIPPKLPIPWAKNAGGSFIRPIPTTSQIGIQNGAASLNDGFVPDNFLPTASGGVPPFGQDMNGILNWATEILQWNQVGGPWPYDPAFSSEIGGYPAFAVVASVVAPAKRWMSAADNNVTDPDSASSTNWITPLGMLPSGTPVPSFSSIVPAGFVAANGLTIGSPLSSATGLALNAAMFLFVAIWNAFSNSQCPILNSNGSPGTRGANPFLDFAANKQLTLPNLKGCSLIGVDTMGGAASTFLSGVPIISGNITTPGSQLGENLHTLIAAEIPSITSTVSGVNSTVSGVTVDAAGSKIMVTSSTPSNQLFNTGTQQIAPAVAVGQQFNFPTSLNQIGSGAAAQTGTGAAASNNTSGGAHNNVERSTTVFWNLAL